MDKYNGYTAQVWRVWFPFWADCFGCNTTTTVEKARFIIDCHKKKVVYEE